MRMHIHQWADKMNLQLIWTYLQRLSAIGSRIAVKGTRCSLLISFLLVTMDPCSNWNHSSNSRYIRYDTQVQKAHELCNRLRRAQGQVDRLGIILQIEERGMSEINFHMCNLKKFHPSSLVLEIEEPNPTFINKVTTIENYGARRRPPWE